MMEKMMNCNCGESMRPWSYTILRIVAGFVLMYHGYAKVFNMGIDVVTGFFASAGIPAANFFAYAVSYGELIVGALIILGIYTHWAAKYAALILAGTIYFVHAPNGFDGANGGYEYQLTLLAVFILIMSMGDGEHTIKRLLGRQ